MTVTDRPDGTGTGNGPGDGGPGDRGPAGGPGRTAGGLPGRVLRAAVVPTALVAAIGLTGVVLNRVYAGDLLTRLVCGAALGAVLVSVAARRLPSWLVAPLSVTAMLGWTGWSVRLAATSADLPGSFLDVTADAAANAVPRLLTAMIPVEPAPDTVLLPVVAAWLAGLAGAEVALRAGRVLLGFLPATALYVAVVYVVGPNAAPAVGASVVFAGLVAVALATARAPARTRPPGWPWPCGPPSGSGPPRSPPPGWRWWWRRPPCSARPSPGRSTSGRWTRVATCRRPGWSRWTRTR